jgi:hypothetical protein
VGKQQPGHLYMPGDLCPYCGAPKDASGNCLCSIGGTTGAQVPAATAVTSPAGGVQAPVTAGAYPQPGPVPLAGVGSVLVALDGPYAGQSFPITGPSVTIGRDAGRDIVLSLDQSVSRRHARIEEQAGVHVIVDEGSSNGTFVNGVRITMQSLAPGDVIQIGAGSYRYQ